MDMKLPHEVGSSPPTLLVPRFRELPRPPRSARLPRFIAAAVAVAGILTLAGAVLSRITEPLEPLSRIVPLTTRTEAASLAAMVGLGLLVIAGALSRRQRRAWWIALALLVVGAGSPPVRGLAVAQAGGDPRSGPGRFLARGAGRRRPGRGTVRRGA